jgi:arginine decarboxylase
MARIETDEPKRLISSAVGLAMPENENNYGYISEHHSYGESEESAGEYAEDLAATMLASTLGIQFDSGQAWVEREQVYKASGQIIETTHCVKSAIGAENGQWTTVISAVVFCGYQ